MDFKNPFASQKVLVLLSAFMRGKKQTAVKRKESVCVLGWTKLHLREGKPTGSAEGGSGFPSRSGLGGAPACRVHVAKAD